MWFLPLAWALPIVLWPNAVDHGHQHIQLNDTFEDSTHIFDPVANFRFGALHYAITRRLGQQLDEIERRLDRVEEQLRELRLSEATGHSVKRTSKLE
ncbi:hypothetical protein MPH_10829 [Macrophomina phaseolina MS6]|uniref:Uncharacterized protein n=1 Tax=Macrophomina phaseolina (strain MS6) TaxID=1126212 RepID=K2RGS0_MACPH|nr:hypothetical protein MPH_10829 [Macrophomina phaseolina MS6]